MSTDRELLELAAKASDIELDWVVPGFNKPYYINKHGGHSTFNPRTEDGEAFRLLVALSLKHDGVSVGLNSTQKGFFQVFPSYDTHALAAFKQIGEDPCQAFREAIFQAAVEIGKAME